MSDPAPDPSLDPELAALYAGERHAPGVGPEERRRIRAQVLATVGVVAATGTSAATATAATAGADATAAGVATGVVGSTGKLVTVVLALGAVGGGSAALLHETDRAATPAANLQAPVGARASVGEPRVGVEAPAASAVILEARESAAGHAASDASASRRAPPRKIPRDAARAVRPPATGPQAASVTPSPEVPEAPAAPVVADRDVIRAELTRAWKLLARGDASGSLAVLARFDATAPADPLAEEREALMILALVRADRVDDARPRAAAFVTRFPSSIHRASIERALVTNLSAIAEQDAP